MEITSSKNQLKINQKELSKIQCSNGKLLCPQCKESVPLIDQIGISSSKIPFVTFKCQCLDSKKEETIDLEKYLQFLTSVNNTQSLCFKHPDRPSMIFCQNCSLNMCNICYSYHVMFESSHTFLPPETDEKIPLCPIHANSELRFFCDDCNTNICIQCAKNDHFDHKVMQLTEYWERVNNKIVYKSNNAISAFMKEQEKRYDCFIQNQFEKINAIIFNMQQIKAKLEQKSKKIHKANKSIGLFVNYIFSDFFKGKFNPNFQLIQNIERIAFEDYFLENEIQNVFEKYSKIEEEVNKLFNHEKESPFQVIVQISKRISPLKLYKGRKERTISKKLIFDEKNQEKISSINYWLNEDANPKKKISFNTTNCTTNSSNEDKLIKIIKKEDILKSLNISSKDPNELLNDIRDGQLNHEVNIFLRNKTKRIEDREQILKSLNIKETKSNETLIKIPLKGFLSLNNNIKTMKVKKHKKFVKKRDIVDDHSLLVEHENNNGNLLNYQSFIEIEKERNQIENTTQGPLILRKTESQKLLFEKESLLQMDNEFYLGNNDKLEKYSKPEENNCENNNIFPNFIKSNSLVNSMSIDSQNDDSIFFNKIFDNNENRYENVDIPNEAKSPDSFTFEKCVLAISSHSAPVTAISQLKTGKLISGGKDNVINIYSSKDYDCVSKIETHNNHICCLVELFNGNIAVGFNDNSIKIYELSSNTCMMILIGHSKPVTSIVQKDISTILSCSEDNTIKMWDLTTKSCLMTYNEHCHGVCGVIMINESIMISASKDSTLKQWNYSSNKSLNTLKGHSSSISMIIKLFNDQLATASTDKTIKFWDEKLENCQGILTGHTDQVSSILQLVDGNLASSSFDSTMKIWNLKTLNCIKTIIVSTQRVNMIIQLFDGSIVTGAEDSLIKIWI